jgi:hypothetical protein
MRHLALLVAVGLVPGPAFAQSREEVDFVLDLFADLQIRSFEKRVEFCGFLGRDGEGRLVASGPTQGNLDSCPMEWPDGLEVIASYHTHGAFDYAYFNELPSDIDMLNDQSLGIDGWVATPGGRLWFIDSSRMVTKQVCSLGCLPIAPGFYKAQAGDIAKGYTFEELVERLGL